MKNKILKAITTIAAFILIIGLCSIDSDSIIPVYMIIGSMIWLIPFVFINMEVLSHE